MIVWQPRIAVGDGRCKKRWLCRSDLTDRPVRLSRRVTMQVVVTHRWQRPAATRSLSWSMLTTTGSDPELLRTRGGCESVARFEQSAPIVVRQFRVAFAQSGSLNIAVTSCIAATYSAPRIPKVLISTCNRSKWTRSTRMICSAIRTQHSTVRGYQKRHPHRVASTAILYAGAVAG